MEEQSSGWAAERGRARDVAEVVGVGEGCDGSGCIMWKLQIINKNNMLKNKSIREQNKINFIESTYKIKEVYLS